MGEQQVVVKWKMFEANVNELMLVLLLLFCCGEISYVKASVSYDHKAVIVNGQRRILISGSIHYPRSTPEVFLLLLLFFANVARDSRILLTFCQMSSSCFSFRCRCGLTLYKRPKMEVWTSFRLMSFGMDTSLLEEM